MGTTQREECLLIDVIVKECENQRPRQSLLKYQGDAVQCGLTDT